MPLSEIASDIMDQSVTLEQARAVLMEAMDYFDLIPQLGSAEATYLVQRCEHIGMLLHVVNRLMFEAVPELDKTMEELGKISIDEKEVKI